MAKINPTTLAIVIVVIAGLVFGYGQGWFAGLGVAPTVANTAIVQQTAVTEAAITSYSCPDTKNTEVTINVMNSADTTAATELGAGLYFYEIIDGVVQTNAHTTTSDSSAAATTLPCGKEWMVRVLSADSYEGGENSYITDITGNAEVKDGDIYFSTTGASMTFTADTTQNGRLEFQVYSEQDKSYLNWDGDTSSTDYKDTPGAFEGTANGIELPIGTQGQIELLINYRTNETKRDFNDRGYYISVNASTTVYDIPTLRLDGETLTNVKGQLDEYCSRSYSGEEYVYFANRDVPLNDKGQLYFNMFALAGTNPANSTDDISVTWHNIGTYSSITGSGVLKIGACKDDSSTTDVFTAQRVSVDIS